jgi:predicted subunit of tRNA(5-methylaminomethyl-2-thiouridylate) methyltransferase
MVFDYFREKLGRQDEDSLESEVGGNNNGVDDFVELDEENLDELPSDAEDFEVEFPSSSEEALAMMNKKNPKFAADVLREFNGDSNEFVQSIIEQTENIMENKSSDTNLVEAVRLERKKLDEELDKLKNEINYEQQEKQELDSWNKRINRFLVYVNNLDGKVQRFGDKNETLNSLLRDSGPQILLGTRQWGVEMTAFESGAEGLDYSVIDSIVQDGIGDASRADFDNFYGAGHALEDLNKLYENNLQVFLKKDGQRVENDLSLLADFSTELNSLLNTFEKVLRLRWNIAELKEAEEFEENIVEEIGKESEKTQRALKQLSEEESETEDIEEALESLEKQEKYIVNHLEEAHEVLKNLYEIENRMLSEEQQYSTELNEGTNPNNPVYVHDMLQKLEENSSPPHSRYFTDLRETYSQIKQGLEEIRDLEAEDVRYVLSVGGILEKTIEKYGSGKEIERQVESEIMEKVKYEEEIESRMIEKIEEKSAEFYRSSPVVRSQGMEPVARYEDIRKSFTDSYHKAQEEIDVSGEIEKEGEITDDLENVKQAINELNSSSNVDTGRIINNLLVSLNDIDEEFGDELESVETDIKLIEDLEENLRKFKNLGESIEIIIKKKEQLRNELTEFPPEIQEQGLKLFDEKIGIDELDIDGVNSLKDLKSQFDEDKKHIKTAQKYLGNLEKQELRHRNAVKKISGLEENLSQNVRELVEVFKQGNTPEDVSDTLRNLLDEVKAIDEEENILENDIAQELHELDSDNDIIVA